ncbi:MAG: hypothetical protein WKF94_01985, partial [Solirubrobacteraceae bacterium]
DGLPIQYRGLLLSRGTGGACKARAAGTCDMSKRTILERRVGKRPARPSGVEMPGSALLSGRRRALRLAWPLTPLVDHHPAPG